MTMSSPGPLLAQGRTAEVFAWQDGHYMVSWFELPVSDIDRAKAFYEKVFAIKLSSMDFGYVKIAAFPDPGNATGASGSLMQNPNNQPTGQGTVVYFTVE